jgi:hypothetical protein
VTKPPDTQFSLQEIWRIGCSGEALSEKDREHFLGLARSRFYTFRLGMAHAQGTGNPAKGTSLLDGLVTELIENPGLERVWHGSEFADDLNAEAVRAEIEKRSNGAGAHPLH